MNQSQWNLAHKCIPCNGECGYTNWYNKGQLLSFACDKTLDIPKLTQCETLGFKLGFKVGTFLKKHNKTAKKTKVFVKGDIFHIGCIKNNLREGYGITSVLNEYSYVGYFLHDDRHGAGKYSDVHDTTYEGQYFNNMKHGHGIQTAGKPPDAVIYEGNWVNDLPNGKGKINFKNVAYYDGHLKDGKQHGFGTFIFANGDNYTGMWKNNNIEGKGTQIYANGDKYVGMWKAGDYNGEGTFTSKFGQVYTGVWVDNCLNGENYNSPCECGCKDNESESEDENDCCDSKDCVECIRLKKLEEAKEYNTSECCICLDAKPNAINAACGHLVCCVACLESMNDCPVCRVKITNRIKVYC